VLLLRGRAKILMPYRPGPAGLSGPRGSFGDELCRALQSFAGAPQLSVCVDD
jgi:hypothetical protein